eukprot:327474-Amphidinium_carterae.1
MAQKQASFTAKDVDDIAHVVESVTPHSLRVTLPDAMAATGATHEALMSQGRWKTDKMPFKYTRQKGAMALRAIQALKENVRSVDVDGDARSRSPRSSIVSSDSSSDGETDQDTLYYIHRCATPHTSFKVHISSLSDPERIACGALSIELCEVLGRLRPDGLD